MAVPVVKVKAKQDIVDQSTGDAVVNKNDVGTVVSAAIPPTAIRFQVDFVVNNVTVQVWADAADLIFTDGPIGAVNAILAVNFERLEFLSYPDLAGDHDVIVEQQILAYRGRVTMNMESGLKITVTSSRNTGDLTFEVT